MFFFEFPLPNFLLSIFYYLFFMFNRGNKKKKVNNKFSSHARQRKFKVFTSGIKIPDFLKTFKALMFLIGALLIIGLLWLGVTVLKSDTFKVKEIEIIADNVDDTSEMSKILDKYKGISVFTINSGQLYDDLKKAFPNVDEVFVHKTLNGKLNVEVVQNLAVYYVINFSGTYILDHNAKVLEVYNDNKLLINDFEQKILKGEVNAQGDYVREVYLSKITSEEDRLKVKWDQIPQADKDKLFTEIVNDLYARINTAFQKSLDFLKVPKYANLSGYLEYLSKEYSKGDILDKGKLTFISLVADFLRNKQKVIKSTKWLSEYTLEVTLEESRQILFSLKRDLKDQFRDVETLIFHDQFSKARIIDVRSDNFSVKR
jgi:cell division septal protein FtsQ